MSSLLQTTECLSLAPLHNVVVVRFSVRNKAFEKKFIANEEARNRWFKFRAWLFEASLAPSLEAQTVKPVATFLYFDAADKDLVRQNFSRTDFVPIFSTSSHEQIMGDYLLSNGLTDHVVLSRIDSDDIVERDYFLKINKLLVSQSIEKEPIHEVTVICRSGFRTNFLTMQKVLHKSPPFVNQYFRHYCGQGAYFDHTKVNSRPGKQIADNSAEWMQIIHGTNVANKFKSASNKLSNELPIDTESYFSPPVEFDAAWFSNWSGITPIPPEKFNVDQLPLEGFTAKARLFIRRLLSQA